MERSRRSGRARIAPQSRKSVLMWTFGLAVWLALQVPAVAQPTPADGDTEPDGDVDLVDLSIVAYNWLGTVAGGPLDGDFNSSGVVDALDLAALASNWQGGSSTPTIGGQAVSLNWVDSPTPGLMRYSLFVTGVAGQNSPNVFEVNISAGAHQQWLPGPTPTPDATLAGVMGPLANEDTHLLFANSELIASDAVETITTPTGTNSLGGLTGFGGWSGGQLGMTPWSVPGSSFDFFQLVVGSADSLTIGVRVATPYLGGQDFQILLLSGDANADGVVNILDLSDMSGNWKTTVTGGPADGDFNGDGIVNILDLSILSGNWEATSASAPAGFDAVSVPEPATWLLCGGAVALFGLRGATRPRRH